MPAFRLLINLGNDRHKVHLISAREREKTLMANADKTTAALKASPTRASLRVRHTLLGAGVVCFPRHNFSFTPNNQTPGMTKKLEYKPPTTSGLLIRQISSESCWASEGLIH